MRDAAKAHGRPSVGFVPLSLRRRRPCGSISVMSDVSQDDLFDAIDRTVRDLLPRAGIDGPPVDAVHLAQAAFGFRVQYAEPDDDPPGRFGPRPPRRPPPNTLVFRPDQSDESQQAVAARAVAKHLLPGSPGG